MPNSEALKAAAEAWLKTGSDVSEIMLESALLEAGLMMEDDAIESIHPSLSGLFIGVCLDTGVMIVVNYVTGQVFASPPNEN